MALNSCAMPSPFRVTVRSPSTYTGAEGTSPVPGRLMPISACRLSPGPLTTQPMTATRSEEHTSELQSLMRISYAVFCLKKKNNKLSLIADYLYFLKHNKVRHANGFTRTHRSV